MQVELGEIPLFEDATCSAGACKSLVMRRNPAMAGQMDFLRSRQVLETVQSKVLGGHSSNSPFAKGVA
jgi:hypothetical protein